MRTYLALALIVLNAATTAQTPAIRTGTQIVIVDVTVTDSRGNPVHGLKASDFTVTEDGSPQAINRFEEHSAPPISAPVKSGPSFKLEPGTFTNYTPAPADRPINVVLLDMLNTPQKDQIYVREQLKTFLKTMQPGTRIAIFGLNSRLILLQGFTSDPSVLRAVLERRKGTQQQTSLLPDPIGTQTVSDQAMDLMGEAAEAQQVIANMKQFEANVVASQNQLRTTYTLDAMNQLGRYLSAFPGRKNLIWFSGSFPISVLPMPDDPTTIQYTSQQEFRDTTNLLTRSQVAVYPVDARGVFGPPMLDASNSGSRYARTPQAYAQDMTKFSTQTASENSTMLQMAEATGGKAFLNTNDLHSAVQKAIDSGSNYYTLVYSPSNKNWNTKFRKISVQTTQKGAQLSYRRGYYASQPKADSGTVATAAQSDPSTYDPMKAAMQRGGPSPTELLFKAQIVSSQDLIDKVATGTSVAPTTKGPFRQYTVNYVALPGDVTSRVGDDGSHVIALQFVIIAYDHDGKPLTSASNRVAAGLKTAEYAGMMESGVRFSQQISVPAKGEPFLRIGIHDLLGNKVGAIEIPVNAVPPAK